MVMNDASDVIEYGRGRSDQSNAPLHMKQDTTSIEIIASIAPIILITYQVWYRIYLAC